MEAINENVRSLRTLRGHSPKLQKEKVLFLTYHLYGIYLERQWADFC